MSRERIGWRILDLWVYGIAGMIIVGSLAMLPIIVWIAFENGVGVPFLVGIVVLLGPPLLGEWLIRSGRTRADA